jgi:hypothetical protein
MGGVVTASGGRRQKELEEKEEPEDVGEEEEKDEAERWIKEVRWENTAEPEAR